MRALTFDQRRADQTGRDRRRITRSPQSQLCSLFKDAETARRPETPSGSTKSSNRGSSPCVQTLRESYTPNTSGACRRTGPRKACERKKLPARRSVIGRNARRPTNLAQMLRTGCELRQRLFVPAKPLSMRHLKNLFRPAILQLVSATNRAFRRRSRRLCFEATETWSLDWLAAMLFVSPLRCRKCRLRFYRPRLIPKKRKLRCRRAGRDIGGLGHCCRGRQ
jgi:hypothetical protein